MESKPIIYTDQTDHLHRSFYKQPEKVENKAIFRAILYSFLLAHGNISMK